MTALFTAEDDSLEWYVVEVEPEADDGKHFRGIVRKKRRIFGREVVDEGEI